MAESGTVDKAVDVLFHLHQAAEPRGVTALGEALGLPKSSAHRLLATLARRGLVERDARGRYALGPALVTLGAGLLDRDPVVAAARPLLAQEAAALGETCFLVAARAGRLVVLAKAEGTGLLRASPQVGAEVPVHATAAGKLYLALAPDQLVPEPGSPAPGRDRFTDRTLDPAAFAQEVERAGEEGFARNREEWIEGLSVVAVPIEARGRLRGVVALAAATARLEALGGEAVGPRLQAAAERVAERLGGSAEREPEPAPVGARGASRARARRRQEEAR